MNTLFNTLLVFGLGTSEIIVVALILLLLFVTSYFVGGYFYKFLKLENTAHWKKFAVGFIITLILLVPVLLFRAVGFFIIILIVLIILLLFR